MTTVDYNKALHYTIWQKWDDLVVIMVRTQDDLLRKRINDFLKAIHADQSAIKIVKQHDELLHYLDFVMRH